MSEPIGAPGSAREPVLNPVDRVSELLFGLFMALTFVGAISVAESGRAEIRSLLAAALGCNLAWGLVDAVMYLVRTVTDRGRAITLTQKRTATGATVGGAVVGIATGEWGWAAAGAAAGAATGYLYDQTTKKNEQKAYEKGVKDGQSSKPK